MTNSRQNSTYNPQPKQDHYDGQSASFLKTARALKLDGPTDWAEMIDEYLYGGKRIDDADR